MEVWPHPLLASEYLSMALDRNWLGNNSWGIFGREVKGEKNPESCEKYH